MGLYMVSVMSATATERRNKKGNQFREFIEQVGGIVESLPGGSFRKSGTMVETCLFMAEKRAI